MFVTKMSLPRRAFLRGVGAAVALPLLDAMVPAFTAVAKTAAAPKRRLGFVYVPNGMIMEQWTPATVGHAFELTPLLATLEPYKDSLVVIGNLSRPGDDNDHAVSSAGWLSGAIAKETEGEDFRAGLTIDQIVARQISQDTPFPSLELATEDFTGFVGGCSPGYACAYVNTISWADATTPLPMEINPRIVFERMFGRAGTSAQRRARMRTNKSVLDSIAADLEDLERGLSARDRSRVDEYLQHVREIERRIERTEASGSADINLDAPIGVPSSFDDHVDLMFDLLTVAYQADTTRVFTFMMAREFSMRTYPDLGISEPHHAISHHGNKPEQIARHAKINQHHLSRFARFLDRLRATPDGDGTLYDHSLIFYGAGMSNGNAHSAHPLPLAALGGGVGKGHRFIAAAPRTPIGNLWVGVANQFGSDIASLGISNGQVSL
jgi:hypothetical protein